MNKFPEKNNNLHNTSLPELIEYIDQCGIYITKKLLPELQQHLENISVKDNKQKMPVADLKKAFSMLRFEIEIHFIRERAMLIPYVNEIDSYYKNGGTKPVISINSIDNPISLTEYEHYFAKQTLLKNLHNIRSDFQILKDTFDTFKNLYEGFTNLEERICEHFMLVSNSLLPKAIQIEMLLENAITQTDRTSRL